jgi:hypothetical protein
MMGEKLEMPLIRLFSSKSMIPVIAFYSFEFMPEKWKIIKTHHG